MRYLLMVVALLSGCASSLPPAPANREPNLRMIVDANCEKTNYNMNFMSDMPHQPTIIEWKTVADPHSVCKESGSHYKQGSTIIACAVLKGNRCTIYSGKYTSLAVLGHETRHCFEGNWHQ